MIEIPHSPWYRTAGERSIRLAEVHRFHFGDLLQSHLALAGAEGGLQVSGRDGLAAFRKERPDVFSACLSWIESHLTARLIGNAAATCIQVVHWCLRKATLNTRAAAAPTPIVANGGGSRK